MGNNDEAEAVDDEEDNQHRSKVFRILQRSIIIRQISHKMLSAAKVVGQNGTWIQFGNVILILILDIFMGMLLSSYLAASTPNLYELVHGKIEELLQVLLQILEWLSGAPAGLKLNASLNALLGRFFSYNLHLWRNYIKILEPVLKFLLTAIVEAGIFAGFTVQIALVKDLVSITTFHIYCLYIYATRLFNIELNVLKGLGHLFFGRKWNPLRNRIDSVQLSHSEMFLSSLGFTIAVFLSPTIIIYYAVFLCLRLPILVLESFLKFIIQVANSVEIVTLCLVMVNSPMVPHDIYLQPTSSWISKDSSSSKKGRVIRYAIQTRPIFKIKLPSLGKSLKQIFSQIVKSQVITE